MGVQYFCVFIKTWCVNFVFYPLSYLNLLPQNFHQLPCLPPPPPPPPPLPDYSDPLAQTGMRKSNNAFLNTAYKALADAESLH